MATSNFPKPNAFKYFVIFETETYKIMQCTECNFCENYYSGEQTPERCPVCGNELDELSEEYITDWRSEKENLYHALKELLPDAVMLSVDDWESDNERNFTTTHIGFLSKTFSFSDWETKVTINLSYSVGYYEAAILDWAVTFGFNDNDSMEWELKDFEDYANLNTELKTKLKNKLENTKQKLIEQVEAAYEKISTPYERVATFSNGETIYKKL